MRITRKKISKLTLDPDNVRTHDERNIEAIARSLETFGVQSPIVITEDGVVVKGNGTLLAAKSLGWKEIPTVTTTLTGEYLQSYAIADNRTAELAEWDPEGLAAALEALESLEDHDGDDEGLRLAAGFSSIDLSSIRAAAKLEAGQADENGDGSGDQGWVAPVDDGYDHGDRGGVVIVKDGDVWEIGPHRLICGSCTDPAVVDELLGDTKVAIAITSPPYASQRAYDEQSEFRPIPPDDYLEWWDGVQSCAARVLAPDGSFFVNIKENCDDGQRLLYVKDLTLAMARRWGWRYIDEFIWTHGGTPKTPKTRFKNGFEPVFQFTREKHKHRPDNVARIGMVPDWKEAAAKHGGEFHPSMQKGAIQGEKSDQGTKEIEGLVYPSNVLSFGKNRDALGHPAAFPLALPSFFIRAYSDEGDAIFDPFMGSGTTIIAAGLENRVAYGCEVSPKYCDIVIGRHIAKFGGDAVNVATGELWTDLLAAAEA